MGGSWGVVLFQEDEAAATRTDGGTDNGKTGTFGSWACPVGVGMGGVSNAM